MSSMVGGIPEREAGRQIPEVGFCQEKVRLMEDLLRAIRSVAALHTQQIQAVIDDDLEFTRFDVLQHYAQEAKDRAKYALISHVESHKCGG